MVRRYSQSRNDTTRSSGMRRSNETHSTRSVKSSGRKGGRSGRYSSSVGRDEYAEDFRYERERSSSSRHRHRSKGSRYGSSRSSHGRRYPSGRTRESREDDRRRYSRAYESDSRDPSDSSTVSYWEDDEYRKKEGGLFSGMFNFMGDDKTYYSSDATSEQSSVSEITPLRRSSRRHKTGRKIGRPSTERRLGKEEDPEDSSAETVNFETACQVVMYDTLLMWKDPPPPTTKLIEGPKEDSFSQVMNDTLLLWKTPHSPHRHLRIEGSQGMSYESDSCSSATYSQISAKSSSRFSYASTKGPSKSACRNALKQLEKKQASQPETATQLNAQDDFSYRLLGKRDRSVSSLGDNESMVSFSSAEQGSPNATETRFILEKPFTSVPVPGSLGLDMSNQGLQVTAPSMASTFAPMLNEDQAHAISSAFMAQDRDRLVQDKIAEIMMKKNLGNKGPSDTTRITLSSEATAFLDSRAADNSSAFEDPTLNQLAVELDSLREVLSTSENIAVSNFIRVVGEGAGIDEMLSNVIDQVGAPHLTNTTEVNSLGEDTLCDESTASKQLDTLANESEVETGEEADVISPPQGTSPSPKESTEIADLVTEYQAAQTQATLSTTQTCATEEVLNEPFNNVESEMKPLTTSAEDRKERLASLMSKLANETSAEGDRKERLASLVSKVANEYEYTKTDAESDLVQMSNDASLAISHSADGDENAHVSNEASSDAGSFSSKQDDVNSQDERSHITVAAPQRSFAPSIETAMSLISFATVDPILASIFEDTECPAENEELYPTANAIESFNTKEECTVAPALEMAPSSISCGTLDYNPSLISCTTMDAALLKVELGERQTNSSSSSKSTNNLNGKEDQTLPLPETTKSTQLPALASSAAKSCGPVSSIAKTRMCSMAGTVKSVLKALVTGEEPDLDAVRALIVKSKAPKLSQEEIMTESMSWSVRGKADPINILLKDMELYVEHEKLHYGELSSAGLFLKQSSDVIQCIISDQKRNSKTLQILDPLPYPAQSKSISPEDIQGIVCSSNNETTKSTTGTIEVKQDFSSFKSSDDASVDSARVALTVKPSASQEDGDAPDRTSSPQMKKDDVKIHVISSEKRLPNPLSRHSEAVVACPDVRLPKPPSPEARFVDSGSQKPKQSSLVTDEMDKNNPTSEETSRLEIAPPSVQTEMSEFPVIDMVAHDSKVTRARTTSVETKNTRSNLRDRVSAPVPWDVKLQNETSGNEKNGADSAPAKENGPIALSNVVMKLKSTQMKSYPKRGAITPRASRKTVFGESKPGSSRGSTSLEAVVTKLKMATGAALAREIMKQTY